MNINNSYDIEFRKEVIKLYNYHVHLYFKFNSTIETLIIYIYIYIYILQEKKIMK